MSTARLRYPQVKGFVDPAALRARLAELGLDLPVDDRVRTDGPLAAPVTVVDGSAGELTVPNRFADPAHGGLGRHRRRPSE